MKIETPQILWHNGSESDNGKNAPLYSLALLECGKDQHVLATAGNTSEIHLWRVEFASSENKRILQNHASHKITHRLALSRHDRSVNVVKFSPNGKSLATAGDGGSIIIWSLDDKRDWCRVEKETDLKVKILSACSDGICDISWSADSRKFVAGSIDHVVMCYELTTQGDYKCVFRNTRDHTAYVQGVSYDPLGVYAASMGSDRTVRVYQRKMLKTSNKKKKQLLDSNHQGGAPKKQPQFTDKLEFTKVKTLKHYHKDNKQYLFADESTVETFFRRLSWTSDGAFLVTPAALWHDEKGETSFATYLFARHCFDKPYKVLPGLEKPSVVIRPNPLKFQLPQVDKEKNKEEENKENKIKSLPYRSVLAVLTIDTVLLYDTYHTLPLCIARGLHYASLTDAAWSSDGRRLFVSSTDGYVSVLSFEPGELGEVHHEEEEEVAVPSKEEVEAPQETTVPTKELLQVLVPPCEPGQTASIVAPPAKRLKTFVSPTPPNKKREETEVVGAAVTNLSIEEPPKKKKKRITPILLNNNNTA